MLRIDIYQEPESTTFTLAGKLMGPWVIELERCWLAAISVERRGSIRVNLAAVAFVDSGGRALLTHMRRQGVALVPTGCLMKAIVEEIENEVKKEPPLS